MRILNKIKISSYLILNEASNHKITSIEESIFANEKHKRLEVIQTIDHQFNQKGDQHNHEENNIDKVIYTSWQSQ